MKRILKRSMIILFFLRVRCGKIYSGRNRELTLVFQCPISVQPWKIRTRNRANVQGVCAMLKLSPLEPAQCGVGPGGCYGCMSVHVTGQERTLIIFILLDNISDISFQQNYISKITVATALSSVCYLN